MRKIKKVALITMSDVPNYGSMLQTYASQKVLEFLGCIVSVIDYKYPNDWQYRSGLVRNKSWKVFIYNLVKLIFIRKSVFEDFKYRYIHCTKRFDSYAKLLSEDWNRYGIICVGSDQVWNPNYTYGDKAFLLGFVPEYIYKFSLASSFSVNTIPQNYRKLYFEKLSRLNAISVRENNGADVVKNLGIEKRVKVILDPTLLLDRKEWNSIVSSNKVNKRKPYILLYTMTYAFDPRPRIYEVVRYFQKRTDYDVYVISGDECGEWDIKTTKIKNVSVIEFVSYFMDASLVVTSSFHGTAFAANFGIPLIAFVPENKGDDRQITLLKELDMEQCITFVDTHIEDINPYYDIDKEQKILATKRADSLSWISATLNNRR